MKKFNRITSAVLSAALLFGCLSFIAPAAETATSETSVSSTEPTAYGIMTPDEIFTSSEAFASKGADFDDSPKWSVLGNGWNKTGQFYYSDADADGNVYLKLREQSITVTAYSDNYMHLYNNSVTALNNAANIKAAVDSGAYSKFAGKPFVLSIDLKADTPAAVGTLTVLNVLSYATTDGKNVSAAVIGLKSSGTGDDAKVYLTYGVGGTATTSSHEVPTDRFETVAVLVTPITNTYSIYIDGELYMEGIKFLSDTNAAKLILKNSSDTAIEDENGEQITGGNAYIPSLVNILNVSKSAGAAKESPRDMISADNIKFYFSDHYLECKAHSFAPTGEHTHDTENGMTDATYECENCTLKWNKQTELDQNGDCLCDLCMHFNPKHTLAQMKSYITASGTSVAASSDLTSSYSYPDFANNKHAVTDEWGNTYISVGKTEKPDASSLESYWHIYLRDDRSTMIKNLNEEKTRGSSFVVQFDVRLEDGFSGEMNLVQFATTMGYHATADAGSAISPQMLKVDKDGYICANLGYKVSEINWFKTDIKLEVGAEDFTTVAMHVSPSANTYDIYIDGEARVRGLNFISDSVISTHFNYTRVFNEGTDDEYSVVVDGADDFVLTMFRLAQTWTNSPDSYRFSVDNAIMYYSDDYVDDYSSHDLSIVSATKKGNGYIELNYVCEHCADEHTVTARGFPLNSDSVILGRSASLGDNVGFKLYAELGEKTLADETAKMVITVGERVNEYAVSEAEKKNGRYVFSIDLSALEMSSVIEAKIVTSEGEGSIYQTTFESYATALISALSDENMITLVKSALNYGAYAQDYFAKKDGLSFAASPEKYLKSELEALTDELSQYTVKITDTSESITPLGASLVLDSRTSIKVFFKGRASVSINGAAASVTAVGTTSYVVIENIMPQMLADYYKVVITAEDGYAVITVSAMSCAALVLENEGSSDEFRSLAKALYLYQEAASVYKTN